MATGHNPLLTGMTGSFGGVTVKQRSGRTGRETVVSQKVTTNTSLSDRQRVLREQMTLRAELWHSLTPVNARSWVACGAKMRDPDKQRGQDKLSGYNCWQAINGVRQSLQLPPLLTAPTVPFYLPEMGKATSRCIVLPQGGEEREAPSSYVSAPGTEVPGSPRCQPGVQAQALPFSLTLFAEASAGPCEHTGPFLIFAAPADVGGRLMQGRNRYTLLCAVEHIGEEGVDLSREFAEAYGAVRAGERVCLRVVPVTPEGFKGRARVVTTDVELAAVGEALIPASPPFACQNGRRANKSGVLRLRTTRQKAGRHICKTFPRRALSRLAGRRGRGGEAGERACASLTPAAEAFAAPAVRRGVNLPALRGYAAPDAQCPARLRRGRCAAPSR